jgi:glycosyltransferase involved in cell wall biosynthesis
MERENLGGLNRAQPLRPVFVLTMLARNGAVHSALSTIRNLDRSRFRPTLLLMERPTDTQYWEEHVDGIPVVYGLGPTRSWPSRSPAWIPGLIRAGRAADIIIGAQGTSSTYAALLAGRLTNTPVVGMIRNSIPDHLARLNPRHLRLTRALYPRLNAAIAVSDGLRRGSEKFIPALAGKIVTAHPVIEADRIQRGGREPAPANLPARFIVAAGRLDRQKGFDILVRAYANLRRAGIGHDLVILGEGEDRRELEALIAQLNLTSHVMLPGFVANPFPWIRAADLFVSSSRYEGFGRVIAEALALGTPVVATDCPHGPAEVLGQGRYGNLVEPENPVALGEAIRTVLSDRSRLRVLSELGPVRAGDFGPIPSGRAFEDAITDVLGMYPVK